MVTIKKHGVFCKEERCKYCGCVIEYGPRDVTYEFDYNNSQDKYYHPEFVLPY